MAERVEYVGTQPDCPAADPTARAVMHRGGQALIGPRSVVARRQHGGMMAKRAPPLPERSSRRGRVLARRLPTWHLFLRLVGFVRSVTLLTDEVRRGSVARRLIRADELGRASIRTSRWPSATKRLFTDDEFARSHGFSASSHADPDL